MALSVNQLQDLLQAQTASLEQLVTTQIANLQANLESTIDQKLESKIGQVEERMKQFMKDTVEADDGDDADANRNEVNSSLAEIRDHVLQMEQSMAANGSATGGASNNNSNSSTEVLQKTLLQACQRMEESLDDHMDQMTKQVDQRLVKQLALHKSSTSSSSSSASGKGNLKRTPSMDHSNHSQHTAASSSSMARVNQQLDDTLGKRLATMEQFIDTRHSELEAYYGSESSKLHKLVVQSIRDALIMTPSGSSGDGSARNNNNNSHNHTNNNNSQQQQHAPGVTKAEMEAILDARMDNASSDSDSESDSDNDDSNNNNNNNNKKSSKSSKKDTTTKALEQLLQQQKEWIDLQASTSELELQVQQKLQALEETQNNTGTGKKGRASLQKVHDKMDSLEKVVLAAMATSAFDLDNASKSKAQNSSKRKSSSSSQPSANKSKRSSATKTGRMLDESSSNNNDSKMRGTMSASSSRATAGQKQVPLKSNSQQSDDDVYMDVSVDGQRLRSMNADLDGSGKSGRAGGAVKSFMSTLDNWRDLNTKEKGIREHSNEDDIDDIDDIDEHDGDDIEDVDDHDVISDSDNDIDVTDNQSSRASLSVDSSMEGDSGDEDDDDESGGDKGSAANKTVIKALQQMETKMDRVEAKVKKLVKTLTMDDLEEMVNNSNDTLKSDLKQWLLEQQDEYNSSNGQLDGMDTSGNSRVKEATVSQEDMVKMREKIEAIGAAVTTNQEFLQEIRRKDAAPVPRELPLQKDIMLGSNQSHAELERKILNHLDTMDKSVQFKLDEIFAELQDNSSARRSSSASHLSVSSTLDQTAIVKVIQSQIRGIQAAITTELKESIPDYGMANSVISENLEEMRQIISEVAISEVELLKTQLGVAEEAEQEALHAIVVLKGQLEETKEQEHRSQYQKASRATSAQSTDSSGGIFNFGAFGDLAGALRGTQRAQPPRDGDAYRRKLSMISHGSGYSRDSGGGLGYNLDHNQRYNGSSSIPLSSKRKSPGQKLEGWKNQFADMEDKSSDLRNLYTQLRGQGAEEWLANSNNNNATATAAPTKSSLKPSGRFAGETKEMEGLTDTGDWI